jgi:hypothetical protein
MYYTWLLSAHLLGIFIHPPARFTVCQDSNSSVDKEHLIQGQVVLKIYAYLHSQLINTTRI